MPKKNSVASLVPNVSPCINELTLTHMGQSNLADEQKDLGEDDDAAARLDRHLIEHTRLRMMNVRKAV